MLEEGRSRGRERHQVMPDCGFGVPLGSPLHPQPHPHRTSQAPRHNNHLNLPINPTCHISRRQTHIAAETGHQQTASPREAHRGTTIAQHCGHERTVRGRSRRRAGGPRRGHPGGAAQGEVGGQNEPEGADPLGDADHRRRLARVGPGS